MKKTFTPYLFQYLSFAGREQYNFTCLNYSFDYEFWLKMRFEQLIESTPELPDEMIKAILKKANVS